MWLIKYQNEFLDLAPGQSTELQRSSPLFIAEKIAGEISTTVQILFSDKNSRLLGHFFFELTVKQRTKLSVELYYEDGTYKDNATLVIESAGMHVYDGTKRSIGGFLLAGISNFFTLIKDKKLSELSLGGVRTKPFTTTDTTDASDGYWQLFQNTWDFTNDYLVAPVRNDLFTGTEDDPLASGYMNKLDADNNLDTAQDVVAFPKLKYVLESIFTESGWQVDFTGLNDTQWEKLVLFSAKPIKTITVEYTWESMTIVPHNTNVTSVSFKLSESMPQSVTCAQFINAICNRYGWAPLFETGRKCRFVALKEMKNKAAKNFTDYMLAKSNSSITKDKKYFSFKNSFGGNDAYPSSVDLKQYSSISKVYSFADLPNAFLGDYDRKLVYSFQDNQYYKPDYDPVTGRVWQTVADNIYDEVNEKETDEFSTDCTTLPIALTKYRIDTYFALFPYCKQSQFESWGIRTMLYHGLVNEVDAANAAGDLQYPYLSSTHLPPDGSGALTWSNVFKQEYDATEYGIIKYWWQNWLDIIKFTEDAVQLNFRLPMPVFLAYKWDDKISVNNQEYILKEFVEMPAADGCVDIQATAQRVIMSSNPFFAKIYLKLETTITATGITDDIVIVGVHNYYANAKLATILVKAYSDAAGTIPVSVDGLAFPLKSWAIKDGIPGISYTLGYTITGFEKDVSAAYLFYYEYDYSTDAHDHDGHYLHQAEIQPGDGYTVI